MTLPSLTRTDIDFLLRALLGGDSPDDISLIIWEDGEWRVLKNNAFESQDGTVFHGKQILVWKALDVEESADDEPRIIPRAPHDLGSVSGNLTIDYDDGGTQKASLSGDLTVDDVSNVPSGGWMNTRWVTNGNSLTFDSDEFEGPQLVFTNATVWLSIVDFGESKLAVVGSGS